MLTGFLGILLECAAVFCEAFIVRLYLESFFDASAPGAHRVLAYLAYFLVFAVLSVAAPDPIVLISFTLAAMLTLAVSLYQGTLYSKIFAVILFCVLMAVSEVLCGGIVALLSGVEFGDTKAYGDQRVVSLAVSKFAQLLVVRVVGSYGMKKRGQAHAELRRLLPLFACQLFSMALTHYILVTGYLHGGGLTWGPLAVTIGILLGNIMLIWYFDSIAAMYEYKQLAATVEASLEQQVRFYGLLEQRQQETNAHWHDIEKHVAVMRDLKHMGALEIADEYAADLEGALDAMPSVVSTPHPIVSAVLTYGLERAREAGITVKMDVRISGDISAKPVDLCIVLGNIFDNAVEACGALPDGTEKIIEVSIRQMNGALLIEMNNPYCPDDGERKRGGRLGIGLKNVEHVAGKYGGNVKVSSSDEAFTVSVLLP